MLFCLVRLEILARWFTVHICIENDVGFAIDVQYALNC